MRKIFNFLVLTVFLVDASVSTTSCLKVFKKDLSVKEENHYLEAIKLIGLKLDGTDLTSDMKHSQYVKVAEKQVIDYINKVYKPDISFKFLAYPNNKTL